MLLRMSLALLRDLSRPKLLDIVMLLKRSPCLSVNEMAGALCMSYMGVKQNCVQLEKLGYLDTWLRPKKAGGRPEKMYRLTGKMEALFPNVACDLVIDLLEAAEKTVGRSNAEAMLEHHFMMKAQRYLTAVKGRTLLEKVQAFTKVRQAEGCVASCEFSAQDGLRLVEYHSPIAQLARTYPKVSELETRMVEAVVGCAVERVEQRQDRLTRVEFRMKAKLGK